MECRSGFGNKYIVLTNGKHEKDDFFVLDPMHDKNVVRAMEVYYNTLEPNETKFELGLWIEQIKKHWKAVENDTK